MRLWLGRILLSVGVVCVGVWAASQVAPLIWQFWANRELDRAIRNPPPGASPATPAAPLETGHLIGRLSIPRLHFSSIVREGDDETTLSLALGHIPGTALPGAKGNVGVAGHRDTIFRPLREIRRDDLIRFETVTGTRMYQVDSTKIVKPEDVSVLDPRPTPSLTLVTCYPFYYVGSAPERFIVSAHEIKSDERKRARPETEAAATGPGTPPIEPAVLKPVLHAAAQASPGAATFEIAKGQEREVAPGISIGVSDTDPQTRRVYGWVWLKQESRSVIMRAQLVNQPLVFYQEGRRRELRFTGVSSNAATGRISLPAN